MVVRSPRGQKLGGLSTRRVAVIGKHVAVTRARPGVLGLRDLALVPQHRHLNPGQAAAVVRLDVRPESCAPPPESTGSRSPVPQRPRSD